MDHPAPAGPAHRHALTARAGPLFAAVLLAMPGSCASQAPRQTAPPAQACRCRPGQPCWPSAAEWQTLAAQLHGKLERPVAAPVSRNPFALQDSSAGTESAGWLKAWTARPSAYAVVAHDAADVAAAVRFARRHSLRLVVKGTGHDYLGRSSAPDSLLVWTHAMRDVTRVDAFVPRGCEPGRTPAAAVTVGAGARWLEAYEEVTGKGHRYVQGGGCTSVGVAGGFLQGGGFGSWSRRYGTAAANLLEVEVVTADGAMVVANECQNADLFWALRGGGGGTFGVVTRATLRTHELPRSLGAAVGGIAARDEQAFRDLIAAFVRFSGRHLENEHWGEQVRVRRDLSLEVNMVFQDLSAHEAERAWDPFVAWVGARGDAYSRHLRFVEIPGEHMWDGQWLSKHVPGATVADDRPGEPPGRFWWAGDADQVSTYWYAYHSRWIPAASFHGAAADTLAQALFAASRHSSVSLHFNKGQAGAADDAALRGKQTSVNPVAYSSAALLIVAAGEPLEPGREPDRAEAQAARARVDEAFSIVREATPGTGAYANEADYFEPDWQQSLWGANYPRLRSIKEQVDPDGLFVCHHCVGSEKWSDDGFCPAHP